MAEEQQQVPKIDFAPVMRECQKYAKMMQDAVDSNDLTEEQYMALNAFRVNIADSFCFLLFGEKFNDIRVKYMQMLEKATREEFKEKKQ